MDADPAPTPTKATMAVEIQGFDLPGRGCDPDPSGHPYDDIHVGVACRRETIDLVPGDAASACWRFDVVVRVAEDGTFDFGGPFVFGKRGERHVGLRWGTLGADDMFTVFRAAKLRFSDVPPALVPAVLADGGRLVGRLGLTDRKGHPVCASVRPPDVVWSTTPRNRRSAKGVEPC